MPLKVRTPQCGYPSRGGTGGGGTRGRGCAPAARRNRQRGGADSENAKAWPGTFEPQRRATAAKDGSTLGSGFHPPRAGGAPNGGAPIAACPIGAAGEPASRTFSETSWPSAGSGEGHLSGHESAHRRELRQAINRVPGPPDVPRGASPGTRGRTLSTHTMRAAGAMASDQATEARMSVG